MKTISNLKNLIASCLLLACASAYGNISLPESDSLNWYNTLPDPAEFIPANCQHGGEEDYCQPAHFLKHLSKLTCELVPNGKNAHDYYECDFITDGVQNTGNSNLLFDDPGQKILQVIQTLTGGSSIYVASNSSPSFPRIVECQLSKCLVIVTADRP